MAWTTGSTSRVAITFTPGVPPIWTWLVRYYEREFKIPRGMGLWKAGFDTACLFLAVSMLAVWFTAALVYRSFQ